MIGLAVTVLAVVLFSGFTLRQMERLKALQTQILDRNRRESLQLLRIQNDLNSLGLAMRDMLDGGEPYPLTAWENQFDRTRTDLADALRLQNEYAPAGRSSDRGRYFSRSLTQFWTSSGQTFERARQGRAAEARDLVRTSLQPQQSAMSANVARLLVQNNETEEQATETVQSVYGRVQQNIYYLLAAVLVAIAITSVYMVRSNRILFERLARLSAQKSDLSRRLISMQEELFRSLSRELHDEFGQILTAIGAMLSRASKRNLPDDFRDDLLEVRKVAQSTLDRTRSLSQALHPTMLEDGGLEQAMDWYLPVFEKQTGIKVSYEKTGRSPELADGIAIHVYRVMQEALNNMAKHSQSPLAWVRVRFSQESLNLEVEDRGVGMPARKNGTGLGIVAMRERAELVHGRVEFLRPAEGGTLVRLSIPLSTES